jgi:hypothetical protein
LYLTGADIAVSGIMGELQGAWIAANSILGIFPNEYI